MVGRRYRRHRQRTGRLHPAAIVGICLGGAILLTLLIGNLLYYFADDETYNRLTDAKEEETQIPDLQGKHRVPSINAYPYAVGEEIEPFIGVPAVALMLNTPDGVLTYTSPVAQHFTLPFAKSADLTASLGELRGYVSYISGLYTPRAFANTDTDLFYACALKEAALLREFTQAGGHEILLYGLPLTEERMSAVLSYVKMLKAVLPNTSVGVAIPYETASRRSNWEILALLTEACDFCALDLTAVTLPQEEENEAGILSKEGERLLSDTAYYREQYGMRLLLAENQTALVEAVEIRMFSSYAIVKEPLFLPSSPIPDPNEETTQAEAAG